MLDGHEILTQGYSAHRSQGGNMKSRSICWAVVGVFAAALVTLSTQTAAQTAQAGDAEIRISQMEIDIWPEYDDPRVLVIYQGELESDVEVPSEFLLLIPRGAQIHMAGALGERGEHLHALFETRPAGDRLTEVSYQLETRKFYMEFYYDPITGDDAKEFRYPLVSVYPTARLLVRVQQPLKASDFRTTPLSVDVLQDAGGFNDHRLIFDDVAGNDENSITVSYVKSDGQPSVAKAGASAPSGSTAMRNILIVGAVLLVGAVGVGAFASSMKRKAVPVEAGASRVAPDAGNAHRRQQKFCRTCGVQMSKSDKFCGECGAKA